MWEGRFGLSERTIDNAEPTNSPGSPESRGASRVSLTFDDNDCLKDLVGEFGSHLKLVARALGVDVQQRGSAITVEGEDGPQVRLASRVIRQLYGLVAGGWVLHPADVSHAVRICLEDPDADLSSFFHDTVVVNNENRPISPRSAGQRAYVHTLRQHAVVFGVGPAGTGKTYLAMAVAVAALKRGDIRRIVLTRPAVEAGEKLGFLPGNLSEKVDPYLRPLYDALEDMIPADRVARMVERGIIEVAPLAFMRGRTLDRSYVILDEAQNTTVEQMKMFLTRLGTSSKMVVTGDVTQIDLAPRVRSGMVHALRVLRGIEGVGVAHLATTDVVRHPLVAEIVEAYRAHDAPRRIDRDDAPDLHPEPSKVQE